MQYEEKAIEWAGARWTLTPTPAWPETIVLSWNTQDVRRRMRLTPPITPQNRSQLQRLQQLTIVLSGATYVLIINEALYFGDSLSFSLLSPNQLRDNKVHIDERHRQHAQDSIFGIYTPSESLKIPFKLDGVVAGFDTRPPTQDELENTSLHVELTSDVEWIPSTFALSLVEEEDTIHDDERMVSTLRARHEQVLASGRHRISMGWNSRRALRMH